MAWRPSDLDKKLIFLKDFISNMGMTVNTEKTKIMIINLRKTPMQILFMIIEI